MSRPVVSRLLAAVTIIAAGGCAPSYSLIPAAPVAAARHTIHVTPARSWNRAPATPFDVAWEENWTQNGPALDSVNFIGGLPDGQAIARQRRKDEQKVPVFRASMSPQDLVSMIESFHRLRRGARVFETRGIVPVQFMLSSGLQFDYSFIGADDVRRRGRSIVSIRTGKLYMMTLDATELHYFEAALPDFEAMAMAATG